MPQQNKRRRGVGVELDPDVVALGRQVVAFDNESEPFEKPKAFTTWLETLIRREAARVLGVDAVKAARGNANGTGASARRKEAAA